MNPLPPLVKWSGSKKSQATEIVKLFPDKIGTYYEPFLGSGAILGTLSPKVAVCGDICTPLIGIFNTVKNNPDKISVGYKQRWDKLQKKGYTYYYEVRDSFNGSKSPEDLLFLSRTCVNGLIRFNKNGDFNNSLHHSRKGINPETLARVIKKWSLVIHDYDFSSKDYAELTKNAKPGDFIYLDPPYLNTKGRYFGGFDMERFYTYLRELNKRKIKYALSFDGIRGDKTYVAELPKDLYRRHVYLHSGNSTFNKVQNGKVEKVFESLYLNY